MRAVLILALVISALAGPVGAQSKGRLAPPPAAPALRGATASAPLPLSRAPVRSVAPSQDLGMQSLYLPPPVAAAPPGGGGQQCRLACAQQYYFCLSNDRGDECPSSWGQCRSGCDAPTLPTNY